MRIKEEALGGYNNWVKTMTEKNMDDAVKFFGLICAYSEQGMDPIIFISGILAIRDESARPYCVDLNEICLAMRAFGRFHTMGDSFRCRWNAAEMNTNYADYIEAGEIKHVISPFVDLGIFSEFYKEDDGPDPQDSDSWRRE